MGLIDKSLYACSGLTQRLWQRPVCPACKTEKPNQVDKKWFHILCECETCGLRYRYPRESDEKMFGFYQSQYSQPGLTTDLPELQDVARLMDTSFRGTDKDASRIIRLFQLLNVGPGSTVLDYGASWGYTSWQLKNAGYSVTAYEISKPRAAFAKHLNLVVETDAEKLGADFDLVFSSHVLEHVPNPLETLRHMSALTRPGGYVVALTPNGSPAAQVENPQAYHIHWGKVHPVLLTERFCMGITEFSKVVVTSAEEFGVSDFVNAKHLEEPKTQYQELLLVATK